MYPPPSIKIFKVSVSHIYYALTLFGSRYGQSKMKKHRLQSQHLVISQLMMLSVGLYSEQLTKQITLQRAGEDGL